MWCLLTLCGAQVAVMRGVRLPIDPSNLSWSLGAAAVLTALALLVPGRLRTGAVWLVVAAATIVLWGDLLYYRFLGDLTSIAVLPEAGQAPSVTPSIRSLVQLRDVLLLTNLAAGTAWLLRRPRRHRPSHPWRPVAAAGLVAAVGMASTPSPDFTHVFSHRSIAAAIGPLAYHLRDAATTVAERLVTRRPSAAQVAEVERWLAAHASTRAGAGPAFGSARGDSLIVLQVESMQAFVTTLTVDGEPLMPHLLALERRGINVADAIDQTSEGRTSDAELLSETSLLPAPHGAAVFEYEDDEYEGLSRVLDDHGYATTSAVAFDGGFWNRRTTHPAFGFERSLFAQAFAPGPRIGWGLNDRDFLAQMAARIALAPRPFFAWMITLSLHHPYDAFPADLAPLRHNPWAGTPFGNYVEAMKFFDNALGAFVDALDRSGVLDRTVLVVYGDHDAGFGWNPSLAAAIGATAPNAVAWTLTDRIPLVIVPPRRAGVTGRIAAPAGLADLAPTVLALLGIDPAPFPFVGRNLLGTPGNAPVVRPYGQWVDAEHLYMPEPLGGTPAGCYEISTSARVDDTACAAGTAEADAQTAVSQDLLMYDLQPLLAAEMNR